MPATSAAAALTSAPRRTLAQNSLRASTRKATAATWKASPITSPISSIQVSSPVTRSPRFQPIEPTMYSTRIHQAIRLRAASAAASSASTNAQAKLVSGKLKM